MAGDTTVVGNLTADPELRYTQNGIAVCGFTIAVNERKFDKDANEWKDGDSLFLRTSVWREPAEHVAQSLFKGMRVFATGKLKQRSYEKDGQNHTVIELEAEEVGPSLRYAVASVTRADNNGQGGRGGNATGQRHPATEDAWATPSATPAAASGDEVPW